LIHSSFKSSAISSSLPVQAAAEPNGVSIEILFRPSTRYRDQNLYLPEGWTEIELLPQLTLLDILATGVTWDELHRFLLHKIVWMAPDVNLCNETGDPVVLELGVNGDTNYLGVHVTSGTADAVVTATCNFLVCLLATCEQDDLLIQGRGNTVSTPLSGASLSLFFQESRDDLRKVVLCDMVLSEDLCLALATMSRLDMEVNISASSLADYAAGAFIECMQSDRGLGMLYECEIDSQILASAFAGTSCVTKLQPHFYGTDDVEKAVLFRVLANNRGLVNLDLQNRSISDGNWMILCESLQAHPTLSNQPESP
jgi:hypothetical protein